ncbi:hypothetical protein ACJX0J_029189 [Zea mays]
MVTGIVPEILFLVCGIVFGLLTPHHIRKTIQPKLSEVLIIQVYGTMDGKYLSEMCIDILYWELDRDVLLKKCALKEKKGKGKKVVLLLMRSLICPFELPSTSKQDGLEAIKEVPKDDMAQKNRILLKRIPFFYTHYIIFATIQHYF